MIKVQILENKSIVREGIKVFLKDADIQILENAGEVGHIFRKQIPSTDIIVISSESLLQFSEILSESRNINPSLKFLCIHDEPGVNFASIKLFLSSGMDACVAVRDSDEVFLAIKKIMSGDKFLSSYLGFQILKYIESEKSFHTAVEIKFSDEEKELMNLIVEGLTNKEMALILKTSIRTIEARRARLLKKTATMNTAMFVKYAVINQLVN